MADQRPQEGNGTPPQVEDVVAGLAQEDELGLFDFFNQFFGAPPTVDEIRKATKEELLHPNRFKCGCTILGYALKHSNYTRGACVMVRSRSRGHFDSKQARQRGSFSG
jgi:hypothetical protein